MSKDRGGGWPLNCSKEEEGIDGETLNELESGVEKAVESLVTMREARHKLQEVRKDCGCGKIDKGRQGRQRRWSF